MVLANIGVLLAVIGVDASRGGYPARSQRGCGKVVLVSQIDLIKSGYAFEGETAVLGVALDDAPVLDAPIRIPIAMFNRHGLVAGATGTGKTKTLQVMAEALSTAGVPVFAADIKGDLSGMASPGEASEKLLARTAAQGQDWQPTGFPTEFYALGGEGIDTRALSQQTMECKTQPGLYFIGEVVDVTGWLGGYNFQWPGPVHMLAPKRCLLEICRSRAIISGFAGNAPSAKY